MTCIIYKQLNKTLWVAIDTDTKIASFGEDIDEASDNLIIQLEEEKECVD